MPLGIKVNRTKLLATVFTAVTYICWLWVYMWCKDLVVVPAAAITAISIFGVILVVGYILFWRKLNGELFTPWIAFLAFFAVFNFGQCFLWAVGIHSDREIGERLVYSTLAADNHGILLAQLQFIISLTTLNCGAILIWNQEKRIAVQPIKRDTVAKDSRYLYLYYTALILSVLVIPVTLYNALLRFRLSQNYGYASLYYGTAATEISNPIVNILEKLFLPCLLGLLIGSGFRKRVRVIVYGIYLLFAAAMLLSGDRGEWINPFLFLFGAEFHMYKKRSGKSLLLAAILGILALTVIDAIVSLRNVGLSWDLFLKEILDKESNPIVSMLVEFGQSMGICILLIKLPVGNIYGNTYLMSIPTVLGTSLGNALLGTNYVQLHTWYPKYLGISYGTDFSIIGEAILNYGQIAAPLILLIEGVVIAGIAQVPYRRDRSPLTLCLSLSVMAYVVKIARSTVWLVLNSVMYMLIIFPVCYLLVKLILNSKGITCWKK